MAEESRKEYGETPIPKVTVESRPQEPMLERGKTPIPKVEPPQSKKKD
jgi:hypothetical protein